MSTDPNGEIINRIPCCEKQRFLNGVCFSAAIGGSNNLPREGTSLMYSICHSVPISLGETLRGPPGWGGCSPRYPSICWGSWGAMLGVPKGLTWGCSLSWKGSGPSVHDRNSFFFFKGYSPSQALPVICGLSKRLECGDPLDIDPAQLARLSDWTACSLISFGLQPGTETQMRA